MPDPTSRPSEPPDDVDAAFEAIVAGFEDAAAPPVVSDEPPDDDPPAATDTGGWADLVPEPTPAPPEPEETFQPPVPPPLPRADALTWLAWFGAVGAPAIYLLLSATGWIWQGWQIGLVLVGFLGGFALLVSRMREDSPDDHDPGNGAVV